MGVSVKDKYWIDEKGRRCHSLVFPNYPPVVAALRDHAAKLGPDFEVVIGIFSIEGAWPRAGGAAIVKVT